MERIVKKGIYLFILSFMIFPFLNGKEKIYPKGEEVVSERRYYLIYLYDRMENILNVITNFIEEYKNTEKINIYGNVYPIEIEKEKNRSDEYKWRKTEVFNLRLIYNFNYHYKINNGWMYFQIYGKSYRNIFSLLLDNNKYNIRLTLALYYFPWKSYFNYRQGEQIKEEEEKFKSFSKFVNSFEKYMKMKGINIKKKMYMTGWEKLKGNQPIENP